MLSKTHSDALVPVVPNNDHTARICDSNLIEAAFQIPGDRSLWLNSHKWGGKAGIYLTHAVAREPYNLRGHIQRINLYLQSRDAEGVYGALLDLFIALTDNGRALRERMLKNSRDLLSQEQRQTLLQHLDEGISSTDPVPPARTSVFSKGYRGTNKLVEKLDSEAYRIRDPRKEASDYMEYGQVGAARQVLEEAILNTPSRCELHYDLLEIYKSTHDKDRFLAMYRQMTMLDSPIPETWQELAIDFGVGR